jgi:anti-sigma factor RsiW
MNCDQAIELLPWFLNDTLEAGEREEVRRHLETCSRCQEALAETRESWRILDQHLPTEALVALAYGETPTGLDPALVDRHLSSCPSCAAELEMVTTSRRLEEDDNIVPFREKPRPQQPPETGAYRGWRTAAVAASLAGLVAVSGWIHSARQTEQLAKQARPGRTEIAAASPQRLELATSVNIPPDEEVRDQAAGPITLPAPAVGRQPVFALGPSYAGHYSHYEIEIRNERGDVLATAPGVPRDQNGYYGQLVFKGDLKPGVYKLQVFGVEGSRREALETYSVRQP